MNTLAHAPSPTDLLHRWQQVSAGRSARLVRLTAVEDGNQYHAQPVAFDETGAVILTAEAAIVVVNLAEPAGQSGAVPAGTDALAIDAGGRWIVFVRQTAAAQFCAKVLEPIGGAAYVVRPQVLSGAGQFVDEPLAADLEALNLAELSLGSGSAVDAGTIVLVQAQTDAQSPPAVQYLFDHPVYAKYLD